MAPLKFPSRKHYKRVSRPWRRRTPWILEEALNIACADSLHNLDEMGSVYESQDTVDLDDALEKACGITTDESKADKQPKPVTKNMMEQSFPEPSHAARTSPLADIIFNMLAAVRCINGKPKTK